MKKGKACERRFPFGLFHKGSLHKVRAEKSGKVYEAKFEVEVRFDSFLNADIIATTHLISLTYIPLVARLV